jgi:hypothetical protein
MWPATMSFGWREAVPPCHSAGAETDGDIGCHNSGVAIPVPQTSGFQMNKGVGHLPYAH